MSSNATKLVLAIGAGILTCAGATTLAGADQQSSSSGIPTLRASATLAGKSRAVTRTLALDPSKFQVLSHSASSVTLGFPARRTVKRHGKSVSVKATPCARITVKLALAANATAPQQVVDAGVPSPATEQGSATRGTTPRAWKEFATIEKSSYLRIQGLAAQPTGDGGLASFSVSARMTATGGACGGTNSFTVGPGVEALLSAPVTS